MKFIKWPDSNIYIQETPVTIREWISIMGDKYVVSIEKTYDPDAPKGYLTTHSAEEFISALKLKGTRLPTTNEIDIIMDVDASELGGWTVVNSGNKPGPVKKFKPTYQGLYDVGSNISILLYSIFEESPENPPIVGRTKGNFLQRFHNGLNYTYFSNDKSLPYIGLRLWTKLPEKSVKSSLSY